MELQAPLPLPPASATDSASDARSKAPNAATPSAVLPSFARVLENSIVGQRTNRGWFDEQRRYQLLEQSQVPTCLPQVLCRK